MAFKILTCKSIETWREDLFYPGSEVTELLHAVLEPPCRSASGAITSGPCSNTPHRSRRSIRSLVEDSRASFLGCIGVAPGKAKRQLDGSADSAATWIRRKRVGNTFSSRVNVEGRLF